MYIDQNASGPVTDLGGDEMVLVEAVMKHTAAGARLGYQGPMQHPTRVSLPRRVAERDGFTGTGAAAAAA